MKPLIMFYMGIYLLVTLLSTTYSFLKSKKMTRLRFLLALLAMLVLIITLYFYSQSYHAWQMLGFALGFTSISILFLYNGSKADSDFTKVMLMSFGRFLLHFQFLILLYVFR